MKVKTVAQAWSEAGKLFPTDYELNEYKSRRAGYPVYTSTVKDENDTYWGFWISDLNTRLEVNLENKTVTIWIEEKEEDLVPLMFTKEELDIIRRGLMEYSLSEIDKAKKDIDDENFGLARKHEDKAEVADAIRRKIVKEVYGE